MSPIVKLAPFSAPRSLSGHPLKGEKLVRLVYMDEAGISNPVQEPFLVVCGVIVDADKQLNDIEQHLRNLIKIHIPEKEQEGFVFHAKEIFNGGKTIKRNDPYWTLEKRQLIADDLAKIPEIFDLPIAISYVDRNNIRLSVDILDPRKKTLEHHKIAFATCSAFIERWMRENTENEVCMLISEDNSEARETLRNVHRLYQKREVIEGYLDNELIMAHWPLTKIKEAPLFQPKEPSSPLQIADFCAFVFKRLLMKDIKYLKWAQKLVPNAIAFQIKTEQAEARSA